MSPCKSFTWGVVIAVLLAGCETSPPQTPSPAPAHAASAATAATGSPHDRPGFHGTLVGDELWISAAGTTLTAADQPVKFLSGGPNGVTLVAKDRATAVGYMGYVPGFESKVVDGRLHVWRKGAPELGDKSTTRFGVGPLGAPVRAEDTPTLEAYLYQRTRGG